MHRGLYCPTHRRARDPRQRGALRQFGPSSRQGPARSRALVVSTQLKNAACFLALKTAYANGMPLWGRRCLAKCAGSSQVLSAVRSLPLTPAPGLVSQAVEVASLGAAGARRQQAEEPWGRRAADHAGGRATSALASTTGPEIFPAWPGRQRSSSAAGITILAAHSVPPATRHSQPWPGSTASHGWIITSAASNGATGRVSLNPWTPRRWCRVKPLILRHR